MSQAEAAYLVNAVSAYATVLSGLLTLTLALMMTRQPPRWLLVYLCVLVTGVATVWYHGFGEPFPARVADIGTNLLLAWAVQIAIVGDLYPGRGWRLLNLFVGLANLEYILTFAAAGGKGATPLVLVFGQFGGFTLGELLLILNCVIAVVLLYVRRHQIPARARRLLSLVALLFLLGMLLATASNSWIDFRILAYHAIWHIVGAFGFVALWAFNEARFGLAERAYWEGEWDEEKGSTEDPPPEEAPGVAGPADREPVFSY